MALKGKAEPLDLAAVALLSLLSIAPLYFFTPGISSLFGESYMSVLKGMIPLLIILPLPAAYVATISRNGFRVESLAAIVTLPLALLGLRFAAFSVGLFLGLILVSYKSRSIYSGDNQFWTFFKASAAVVTALGIVLGITAAYAYSASPEVREDVQGNLTELSVETATEFIDISREGVNPESITGSATRLAENVSRTSIKLTETTVMAAVNRSEDFSEEQKQLLQTSFSQSEQDIPPLLRNQTGKQVKDQLQGGQDIEKELIESRTEPLIERVTAPSTPVLVMIFMSFLSLSYLSKFPVGLIGGVYGWLILKFRERGNEGDRRRRREPGGPRQEQERRGARRR